MKIRRITVKVEKTLQVQQYEPVSVCLIAEAELDEDDTLTESYTALYKETSAQAKRFIQNELTKHLAEVDANANARKGRR